MSSMDLLRSRLADVNALSSAAAIFEWDQQTFMPAGGAEARAEHLGILQRMAHETFVAEETRKLLESATLDAESDDEKAMLRVVKRDLDLSTKIPTALVEEKSKLAAQSLQKWVEARANNDFKSFAPYLERMFAIAREEAGFLGYKDHIYDALFDMYEEGATAADAASMFAALKGPQVELVRAIAQQPQIDDSKLYGEWDEGEQRKFTEMLVQTIGFDFNRGRQDTAPHPFCTGWSVGDIRLTTRFKPYIGSAIFGSLHEAGHGMYEQGSPAAWDRTPLAGGVSLGVHESQSRLWENIVGRSLGFWQHFLKPLTEAFPALGSFDAETFYRTINRVQPSLIRVEADELTYNLHVLIRFELECDLLTENLRISDLPEAWNEKYREYLGVVPSTDSEGCLQDVHWAQGSIGYFPTYSMGNVLSYQFWRTLQEAIPDADAQIAKGEFGEILRWLQTNLYSQGRRYSPKDLVKKVTGKSIDPGDYLNGLREKYETIYSI